MRKFIFIVLFAIMTMGLFAANYCSGTVKNNGGGVEGAYVGLYIWTQEYGWLEIDYVRNNSITGFYQCCFQDDEYGRDIQLKVTAYLDRGVDLTKYVTYNGGSIIVNFVYVPGYPD
ncbi:MAG: hypothetical protein HQ534_12445 [Armatimonadetes bacterium]|nr:hypothetical protein [Armatimonadota bacterium]